VGLEAVTLSPGRQWLCDTATVLQPRATASGTGTASLSGSGLRGLVLTADCLRKSSIWQRARALMELPSTNTFTSVGSLLSPMDKQKPRPSLPVAEQVGLSTGRAESGHLPVSTSHKECSDAPHSVLHTPATSCFLRTAASDSGEALVSGRLL
jgi:hypothetical protein